MNAILESPREYDDRVLSMIEQLEPRRSFDGDNTCIANLQTEIASAQGYELVGAIERQQEALKELQATRNKNFLAGTRESLCG